jgi:exodeoxyribonuclease VIII
MNDCPASVLLPDTDSNGKMLGRALHTYLLEGPEVYADSVTIVECTTRTTKIYKEVVEEKEAAAKKNGTERPTIILANEHELVEELYEALMMHPLFAELYRYRTESEVVAMWIDPVTGLPCKCRIDMLTRHGGNINAPFVLVDVKTTASIKTFLREFMSYGYHRQSLFYTNGYMAAGGHPVNRFLFAVVAKDGAHQVGIYEIGEHKTALAESEIASLLRQTKECMEWELFPNYNSDSVIVL